MKDGIRYLQWKPASSVTSPPSLEVWAALRVTEAPGQDGLTDALAVGEDWSAAQVSRAVNASAMLSAYMSALQDDMAERMVKGKPTEEEWEGVRVTTDWILQCASGAAQSAGRVLGLAVAGTRV